MTTKVLLDLDTGIDDALAICYVLGSPDLELIGITATFGNVSQAQSVSNALSILHLLGRDDIPVYPGASHPLVWSKSSPFEPSSAVKAIHGLFGLGKLMLPPSPRRAEKLIAPKAINHLCRSYGRSLAIVATGPLTNIALALDQDPEALSHAGAISCMGGAFLVPGNVTSHAESNINNDPEAASQVFSGSWIAACTHCHAGNQIPKVVGLDVTMKTTLTRRHTSCWSQLNETGQLLASMADFYIHAYQRNNPTMGGCALHDPLAAAIIDHPQLVDGPIVPISVILNGSQRARTLIGETTPASLADKSFQVALEVDSQKASQTIIGAINNCIMQCG
ncbi:nucleoside hydrolase [Leptogranulimonas caecicola]|uniref:Ribosylpyrimidine nucleosidase n=1 Tax=Leptogranulimonas caecicola TaxID=2894156 RepID=A0AAU9D2V9_9ACTN|nr:nucleoside hydrolase [Leptogranulimonas caecicola]BDC90729.1 ribosylpyrimidine nucleosidase [Leptogranulimonas caecicola]